MLPEVLLEVRKVGGRWWEGWIGAGRRSDSFVRIGSAVLACVVHRGFLNGPRDSVRRLCNRVYIYMIVACVLVRCAHHTIAIKQVSSDTSCACDMRVCLYRDAVPGLSTHVMLVVCVDDRGVIPPIHVLSSLSVL